MTQKTDLRGLINNCCFGCPDMDNIYFFNSENLIVILISSIIISIVLQKFFNNPNFKIANQKEDDVIEIKQYSFITKTLVVFFILILFFMPIFKLLNTGYFL